MTREEATARVARGAALLDRKRPGWAEQINTGRLDLASNCACILGQLEGSFTRCVNDYCGLKASTEYGFNVMSNPDMNADYKVLEEVWLSAIADRVVPPAIWTHRESHGSSTAANAVAGLVE